MQGNNEERKPLGVRLPDNLKQWLKHQSVDNRRSLNAAIVVRLEESRRADESKKKAGSLSAAEVLTTCAAQR